MKRLITFFLLLPLLLFAAACQSQGAAGTESAGQDAAPPSPTAQAAPTEPEAGPTATAGIQEPAAAPQETPVEASGEDAPLDAGHSENAAAGAATPDPIAVMIGQADPLIASTLGNLSYTGLFPDRAIQLTDGIGRYEEPDSTATPYVRLLDQIIGVDYFGGGQTVDAAVLLEDHSAGSGTFLYLLVVYDVFGSPSQSEPLLVGDRVQPRDLTFNGSQITVSLIAQGPGDELCCASWNVRREYALQEGEIVQTSSEEISQISLSDLDGTVWELIALNSAGEPALVDPGGILHFSGGMVSGGTGCNAYQGEVTSGTEGLFSLVIGPLSASMNTCDEALMLQETAYFAHLSDAVSWRLDGGGLALDYPTADGGFDSLYFAARPGIIVD